MSDQPIQPTQASPPKPKRRWIWAVLAATAGVAIGATVVHAQYGGYGYGSGPRWGGGYHGYGDRGYGDRGYGDRGYGDRGYGDRGYGDRGYGDRGYGERGWGRRWGGGQGGHGTHGGYDRHARFQRFCMTDTTRWHGVARMFVKADLRLNNEQAAEFDRLADGLLPQIAQLKTDACNNFAAAGGAAPERMKKFAEMARKVADVADQTAEPFAKFYATLDAGQRARVDMVLQRRGMMHGGSGMMGPGGEHGGMRGGPGGGYGYGRPGYDGGYRGGQDGGPAYPGGSGPRWQ